VVAVTCIVGVAQDGKVTIGGDSAGVSGWDLSVRADPKVFKSGPFVMGFTSSFRMGQLLQHRLSVAERPAGQEVERFMVVTFIDAVRGCLTEGGFKKVDSGVESGGVFLVGYQGRLFEVHSDFQVAEAADGLGACGCGESYALGALDATPDLKPKRRVLNALAIAERRSAGVAGPFKVVVG
jgi:ATP-dependent protease HslVU (ClpYQ) peptidase subunit